MDVFERLYAKSIPRDWPQSAPPPDHVLLANHLYDVHEAARMVLEGTADAQLEALGLPLEIWRDRLVRIVRIAAALHDLGKANDHFQGMITGRRDVRQNPQGLRHEWATVLMIRQLRDWLLAGIGNEQDLSIAEWAVAGHHPSPNHDSPPKCNGAGSGPEIELLMGHTDFRAALSQVSEWFQLGEPPLCQNVRRLLVGYGNVFDEIKIWSRRGLRAWDRLGPVERRFVAAVKNCLIAADVAGSALPKALPDDPNRLDWITRAFDGRPESGDLESVVDYRLAGKHPREFQQAVAAARPRVVYVKAGCGSGKTLAAYMWAATNHPTRRLYFCYPTTGTATEGFRDYLFDESENTPRVGAKLFHSRRDIDFEIILNTGLDSDRAEADVAARLDSLEAWSTPVVACTVDTVLGLIQNNKRGLFAWPALAQAAFVFDEIHAFDDRLFGALLRFLRDLPGVPALLMTASLPAARETALRELLEAQGQPWCPIVGPQDLEERPRYCKLVAENGPVDAVHTTIATGGKVLWVCNTVKRVMDAADSVRDLSPLLYHSRFKYEHRVAQHKAVIQAFKKPGAALAICSQVAEMSLDLSADLLVTDLAPVPALIQRLGRLNRRAEHGDPTKPFFVVDLDSPLPYAQADLEIAKAWLGRLAADKISQHDLALAWEQTSDHPPEPIGSRQALSTGCGCRPRLARVRVRFFDAVRR